MLNWDQYLIIADKFQHKVPHTECEDFKQDIILRLAEVDSKRNGNGPLSVYGMYRTASYVVKEFWRDWYRKPNALSLNNGHSDNDENGHQSEMIDMLADDNAVDLDSWFDAEIWLREYPERLVKIAQKKVSGITLSNTEYCYLSRFRKKNKTYEQLTLG